MTVATFLIFIVIIILVTSFYAHFINLNYKDNTNEYEIKRFSLKLKTQDEIPSNKPFTHEFNQYDYVGWLYSTDMGEKSIVLPLFGKKMTTCDRYIYFTTYKHSVLPVSYENKTCDIENVGCSIIKDGAHVTIPEYANKVFTFKSIR
ncbi:MAG: hypothetical protein EBU66_15100 [Bacteroidetes bacterium]|nr:hypothetical protein [Bacteroidota bacterium]